MMRIAALILLILIGLMSFPYGAAAAAESEAVRLYSLGRSELKLGNGQAAIDFFSQAIALEPDNHRYYNDRGVAYKRVGDIEKALADYSLALEKKPDYGNALNNRGVAYLSKGLYDKAIRDFTQALKFKGQKGKIYTNRGIAFAEKGNHQKAIEDFEKAVAIPPLDSRAFFYLAESLLKTGKTQEALKVYRLTWSLTKNPETSAYLQKQISRLEKQVASKKTRTKNVKSLGAEPPFRACPTLEKQTLEKQTLEKAQLRRKMRAREIQATAPRSVPNRTIIKQEVGTPRIAVKSLKDMNYRSRMKALSGFSSIASDIFGQGRRFLEEADTRKALVRYEDALHLERRKKNRFGVAWCLLEIGRIHTRLGNNFRAAKIQAKTLEFFESLKADDEIILTLVELGNINNGLGKHEKAASYFAQAAVRANSDEYAELKSSIDDLAKKNTQAAAQRNERSRILAASSKAPRVASKGNKEKLKESRPPRLAIKKRKRRKDNSARYLSLLRKYNKANDHERMIPVLERLGKVYEQTGDYVKVVHCLSVSLAYREERGILKKISEPLARNARVLAHLGRDAEGLELYVRAAALSDGGKDSAKSKRLRSKAIAAAKRMALEPQAALAAFEVLWKARAAGNQAAETQALHKIGSMYERAGNHAQALRYFERAHASMLIQKARSQDYTGDVYAAEKSLERALEILKELDYPLYLNIKNRKHKTKTAAQKSAAIKKD